MAHHTPAPLRAAGAILRALLGLLFLTALIAGVPYLLLAVGHQPTELSGAINLLEQDDGTLFLIVLTCIGWLGWAAFTFSAVVEIIAVLRRRSAPRIKGFGSLQSLASFLIGGIVLLAPTAASAATPGPAIAATATHSVDGSSASTAPSAKAPVLADDADWPQHTVASATELPWDLAEEYLGDGKRWKDIAALNPEIPQLAAGDQFLPKGAVVKLPADARPVTAATSSHTAKSASPEPKAPERQPDSQGDKAQRAPGPDHVPAGATADGETGEQPDSVTVREGDSLWSIADAHGDPEDWPALYQANKGQPTPDGGTFDNPNLIVPGQVLSIPHTGEADQPPAAEQPSTTPPQAPSDKEEAAPEAEADKDSEANKPAPPAANPSPTRTADPAPATARPAESDTALAPAAVWAGAGALAAALVGTLATRRILQQRRRRPGRRIPMPAGRAAATEQGLRAAQHPTGFDLLDTALRSLALNLTAAGRELPALEAVVLHEAKVELHLAEPSAPMKPFSSHPDRTTLWVCSASSTQLADEEQLKDADSPYPALVSIGWDSAGHLVLVDLEHVGILNLTGNADFARHVLQAIAVELASTPLPRHIEVTALADTAPGLDAAAPERVIRIDNVPDATAELESHTADQRRALAAVGANSLRQARLMDAAAGAWTPHVVLAHGLPEGSASTALVETLAEEPHAAGAVIVADAPTDLPPSAWTLDCRDPDHTLALPGSNLPIKLQGLSDAHFADAIELLTLAGSDADTPAPEWTRAGTTDGDELPPTDAHPDQPDTEAPHQDPAGEDGWPDEYTDLELVAADSEPALDETTPGSGSSAPPTGPVKPDSSGGEDTPEGEPAAGPSLADVLAADDDPESTALEKTGPARPTAGPADVALALTSTTAAPAATHSPIPAPTPGTTSTHSQPDDPARPAATAAGDPPEPAAEAAPEAGPSILLLGPISIDGAAGRIDSNRRTAGTELVAFLALNPGVDHNAIDDALWPGRLVGKETRNAVISRTRSWLGKDRDGQAHLPRVQDTGDSRYRLGPAVTCDWSRFQVLARTGLARHDEDGDLALRRALALVRGRPFTGIDPQRYAWAEPIIQEMVSAIVDVAYELSTRRRESGDLTGALWAARRGLLAAEESEMLHRQIFLAHHAAGDTDALREAAARLARINEQLLGGVDMEAETAELLRNLLPRPVTRAR